MRVVKVDPAKTPFHEGERSVQDRAGVRRMAEKIGISMNARLGFSMPTDGKRLYLSAVEQGPNEVWALENFLPRDVAAK